MNINPCSENKTFNYCCCEVFRVASKYLCFDCDSGRYGESVFVVQGPPI